MLIALGIFELYKHECTYSILLTDFQPRSRGTDCTRNERALKCYYWYCLASVVGLRNEGVAFYSLLYRNILLYNLSMNITYIIYFFF